MKWTTCIGFDIPLIPHNFSSTIYSSLSYHLHIANYTGVFHKVLLEERVVIVEVSREKQKERKEMKIDLSGFGCVKFQYFQTIQKISNVE